MKPRGTKLLSQRREYYRRNFSKLYDKTVDELSALVHHYYGEALIKGVMHRDYEHNCHQGQACEEIIKIKRREDTRHV